MTHVVSLIETYFPDDTSIYDFQHRDFWEVAVNVMFHLKMRKFLKNDKTLQPDLKTCRWPNRSWGILLHKGSKGADSVEKMSHFKMWKTQFFQCNNISKPNKR